MSKAPGLNAVLTQVLCDDRGRLMAALIAGLRDFDLAQDALSDAVESALVHWARNGVPNSPRGWLLQVARRKAVDRIRHQARFRDRLPDLLQMAEQYEQDAITETPDIPDRRLALIFTCCHPALGEKSRVALTLRTLGGLSTAQIARAFLDQEPAMGQRLSRAKSKILKAKIPFRVPEPDQWPERLNSVLAVIYLIYTSGYGVKTDTVESQVDLCQEAIFLTQMLDQLCPDEPEILGLLGLLLTSHGRRDARLSTAGEFVPLTQQDQGRWDREMIDAGVVALDRALQLSRPGPYQVKAAISALHGAPGGETDWRQISLLYGSLLNFEDTAVVRLNWAVAMAEAGEQAAALVVLDGVAEELDGYQPFHAAQAEYLGRSGAGRKQILRAYGRAIELSDNYAEQKFLRDRRKQYLD